MIDFVISIMTLSPFRPILIDTYSFITNILAYLLYVRYQNQVSTLELES